MSYEKLLNIRQGGSLDAGEVFDLLLEAGAVLNDNDRASGRSLEISIRLLDALKYGRVPASCETAIMYLADECGLYPYTRSIKSGYVDQIVTEAHRIDLDQDVVLHAKQMEVLLSLLGGENVILSGPTSFGKSLILDAFIAKSAPAAVAAILPTLALIDETRRRISRNFPNFQIVTTVDEPFDPAQPVFFALTQERFVQRKDIKKLDLLFVDEFYKLDEKRDDSRFEILNLALYRGIPKSKQVFLAGPHISAIEFGARWRGRFKFIATDYKTVAVNIIDRSQSVALDEAFINDLKSAEGESSLVFAASPASAHRISDLIQKAGLSYESEVAREVGNWLQENYHPEWDVAQALKIGIGLHHGRVPRAIGQLFVKMFDEGHIKVLICTSTLIEGVNTAAANVFIYDKKINRTDFDFFSFANIRGRVGRMMRHFVGNAFLYHSPPAEVDTSVEIPIFSEVGPDGEYLLLNMEDNDLSDNRVEEKQGAIERSNIPLDILREHANVGIDLLIEFDQYIQDQIENGEQLLWSGMPDHEEMRAVASLALFIALRRGQPTGIRSPKQVAWAWSQLMNSTSLTAFIKWFSETFGNSAATGIDACFQFLQASEFAFPRALSIGEAIVNLRAGSQSANYSYFIFQMENWFRAPWMKVLDEMGVPVPLSERYAAEVPRDASKNEAIFKFAEVWDAGRFANSDIQLYSLAFLQAEQRTLDPPPKPA